MSYQRVNLLVILCGLLSLAPMRVAAAEQPDRQMLARQYAEIVGRLALTDKLFTAMAAQCETAIAMPAQAYSAIDYALRLQTNMSFFQWRKQFSDPVQEAALVKQLMTSTLSDIGGCEAAIVEQWFNGMIQNMLEPSVAQLNALPDLLGISMAKPDEAKLVKVFEHQLTRYKELSLAELRGLAMALEGGLYRYSMLSFTNDIHKDYAQAVVLGEFIYAHSGTAEDLYELADSLTFTDRERAVGLFKAAAEQGSFQAQRWYGNYQACNGRTDDAMLWLGTAKQTRPDEAAFIDDIILEMKELGEPTNCIEGWVH